MIITEIARIIVIVALICLVLEVALDALGEE